MISNCLFPVAGYGTRFLPVTKSIPKEMLPVLTKPLIQFGVEEAMSAGITSMSFVTNEHKNAIQKYFEKFDELECLIKGTSKESYLDKTNEIIDKCQFRFIEQKQMLGLGHAILTGRDLLKDTDAFAVILPDDLCVSDKCSVLGQMIAVHNQFPGSCVVAIEEVPWEEVNKYGIITGKEIDNSRQIFEIDEMLEKPDVDKAPSNLAIIGRYILTNDIFTILEDIPPDHNGEIQITDALMELAKTGKVLGYKFNGTRYDCGSVRGYLNANNFFAKKDL